MAKFPQFTALRRHFGAVIVEIAEILLRELLLKAQFNLVPANIMKNHDLQPVPSGKCSDLPGFFINKFCFHHKYAKKGFYKEFALQGPFVGIYTSKTNI